MYTFTTATGHHAASRRVEASNLPDLDCKGNYDTFWEVNFCATTWFMAKGHPQAKSQIVVWYSNGKLWSGYGNTQKEALDGAMEDAWKAL